MRRSPELVRRLGALALCAALTVLLCEAAAWVVVWIQDGVRYDGAQIRQSRREVLASAGRPPVTGVGPLGAIRGEVVHPYLGFVLDPTDRPGVSRFGFPGRDTPLGDAPEGTIVVAVTGGSFAQGLVREAGETIAGEIVARPGLPAARVEIRDLALGGYKQPQQLVAVLWSLMLGARFDAVVNVDGFNEVALAPAEFGSLVHPLYPRGWAARVGNLVDAEALAPMVEAAAVEARALRWAGLFDRAPLRWSVAANALWRAGQRRFAARRVAVANQLAELVRSRERALGYVATGPPAVVGSTNEMAVLLADAWETASYQLHLACQGAGAVYLHVLQPNQYVPGSKPLAPEERQIAVRADHPYRPGVVEGYPLLVARGGRLRERGLDFLDLTMIFRDEPAPLYVDDCCHLSPEGYRRVGTAVGRALAARLATKGGASRR